jgi:hypothetical protein
MLRNAIIGEQKFQKQETATQQAKAKATKAEGALASIMKALFTSESPPATPTETAETPQERGIPAPETQEYERVSKSTTAESTPPVPPPAPARAAPAASAAADSAPPLSTTESTPPPLSRAPPPPPPPPGKVDPKGHPKPSPASTNGPPPPPPPPPPRPPPSGTAPNNIAQGGSVGSTGDLLGDIVKGKKLKKTDTPSPSPSGTEPNNTAQGGSVGSRGGFLAEIASGAQLLTPMDPTSPPKKRCKPLLGGRAEFCVIQPKEPTSATDSGGGSDVLNKMMKLVQERFPSSTVTPSDAASKAASKPETLQEGQERALAAIRKRRQGDDYDDDWDDDDDETTSKQGSFGQARRRFL